MSEPFDISWVDQRIKEKTRTCKTNRNERMGQKLKLIDASKFPIEISELATTVIYKIEREGHTVAILHANGADIGLILRQLRQAYDLIRFINADDTRYENPGYRAAYSFVSLPLVRTMIDGLYNCTAMLNDPASARRYRIGGFYRLRETLRESEADHAGDPNWQGYLANARSSYEEGLKIEGVTDLDIDNTKNKWPLLGIYLDARPDSPHKQMLRQLTLGYWREYSAISHASYDGLTRIFPFLMGRDLPKKDHPRLDEETERNMSHHVFRAGGLLMCLLTEIQHFCRFDGAHIDQRLADTWAAMLEIYEIRELYDLRYRSLLANPVS